MIRNVTAADRAEFLKMTDAFYHSDAVLHPVSMEIQTRVFEEAIRADTYLEAFVFPVGETLAGYAIINKSFSTEVGGRIIWIEDIYVRPEFRGQGLGAAFFAFLEERFGEDLCRLRLEVDFDNDRAKALYERLGFSDLPYRQMVKDF